VALSRENRFKKRSKHIDVRWSFVVEKQRHGDLRVVSVSRTIMLADILCSPRAAVSFLPFRNTILGLPPAENAPAQPRVAPAAVSDHPAPAAAAGVAPRASMAAHSGSLPATELPKRAPGLIPPDGPFRPPHRARRAPAEPTATCGPHLDGSFLANPSAAHPAIIATNSCRKLRTSFVDVLGRKTPRLAHEP
jgi:hypothetical protein